MLKHIDDQSDLKVEVLTHFGLHVYLIGFMLITLPLSICLSSCLFILRDCSLVFPEILNKVGVGEVKKGHGRNFEKILILY